MGDNIFYSPGLEDKLIDASSRLSGATVFAHEVKDPERYGVVEFDSSGKAISIVEKPINPSSNYAVTGLYFFDSKACEIASSLSPSTRGELEITDVNATYLEMGNLQVEVLDKGSIWLDAGTHQSYQQSSEFVSSLYENSGVNLACVEVDAFKKGLLDKEQLKKAALNMKDSYYQDYLMKFIDNQD